MVKLAVHCAVGAILMVGDAVEGELVGVSVGARDEGLAVGFFVGFLDGVAVGFFVGFLVNL